MGLAGAIYDQRHIGNKKVLYYLHYNIPLVNPQPTTNNTQNQNGPALGGHFHRRRLWSAMVVLVDVGRWRRTSDQPTVGIVKIVYGSIFL
jgi:hypothetical protein